MTVELFDEDASAEIRIETQPARVTVTDAADRDIEVDIESMLHRGIEVGEGLDLEGPDGE